MSAPVGLAPIPSSPVISIVSRHALGGALSRLGAGAAASGLSPWSDAANCLLGFPFVLDAPTTSVSKGFWVNGSAAGGNSEVAVYDASFNFIASTGAIAGAGNSVPQFSIFNGGARTLTPGLYYAAMGHSATTTNQMFRWAVGVAGFWQAMGCWRQSGVTLGSLAATATPGDMTNVAFPLFGLLTSTAFDV